MIDLALTLLLVNSLRTSPLVETSHLDAVARNRADYICMTHEFSHKYFATFFVEEKRKLIGENIAAGEKDALSTVIAWFKSDSHRGNMLDSHYRFTGIGQACGVTVQVFTS